MNGIAHWSQRGSSVSPASLAREMAAMAQVTLAPPPFPNDAVSGNGQLAIVIPGFLAPEMSTGRLRDFLARQYFQPHSWTGGLNLGPMPKVMRDIESQVKELSDRNGKAVALIGVSLGGTTAREIAKRCSDRIARVITLVSPIHLPVVTPLAPLARAASLLWDASDLEQLREIAEPPPVPLTAIVSPMDGVIDWRASVPAQSQGVDVVEVLTPHMTVCSSPKVQRIVAERLARD